MASLKRTSHSKENLRTLRADSSRLGQCSGMTPDDVTKTGAASYNWRRDEALRDADRSGSLDARGWVSGALSGERLSGVPGPDRFRFHSQPRASHRRTPL